MTVLSKMMDPTLDDLLDSENEGDDFDELNYDGTSDEEEDSEFEGNAEDGEEESDDDDDDEFLFDDVKQSIEYIQERYNFFKKDKVKTCSIYSVYLTPKDTETELQDVDLVHKDSLNLVDGLLPKHTLMSFLKEKRQIEDVDEPYYLYNMITHKFDLQHDQLIHLFDHEEEQHEFINEMMEQNNKLSDIQFGESLSIFDKYNSIFVFFTPDKPPRNKNRRSMKRRRNQGQRNTLKKSN